MVSILRLCITWLILLNPYLLKESLGHSLHLHNAEIHHDSEEMMTTTEITTEVETSTYGVTIIDQENTKKSSKISPTDIVALNVGGHAFSTFRSTLTAVPNSLLAEMFNNETNTKNRLYFFDYNPDHFSYLLDQLRTIKRQTNVRSYELNLVAPKIDVPFDFSQMLIELGLNPEQFLYPLVGTHLDLPINKLTGWKQCHRSKYNTPFDPAILKNACKGPRLLVACRSTKNNTILNVAGVGKRADLFQTCSPNSHCSTVMHNETGFYYVENHAWGFQGRPKDFVPNNPSYDFAYSYNEYHSGSEGSFLLNPCDTSEQYTEYRLCWSLRSTVGRGGGDRCGSAMNLHNTKNWERLIYQPV